MSVTKADVNKMVIKESDNKKQEGAVYSTKKGKTDFHKLGDIFIKDNVTLLNQIDDILSSNEELLKKIKILKEVIENQQKRIETLEKVVANYVG
jgi:predicted  nucleic acid-binding Zn-ribbon protein